MENTQKETGILLIDSASKEQNTERADAINKTWGPSGVFAAATAGIIIVQVPKELLETAQRKLIRAWGTHVTVEISDQFTADTCSDMTLGENIA